MARREFFAEAADPSTRECDWCGKAGVTAIEIFKPGKKIGTGQFLYPCARHVATAKRAADAIKNAGRAAA